MPGEFIAFDLETTGLDSKNDEIIEIGMARFVDGEPVERFQSFVKPSIPIPADITHLTGIHQEDVEEAPSIRNLLPKLSDFFGDTLVLAHNAAFDTAFMHKHKMLKTNPVIDTLELASILMPSAPRYSLGSLATAADIELKNAHRALDDAVATGKLFCHLWELAIRLPARVATEVIRAAEQTRVASDPVFSRGAGRKLEFRQSAGDSFAV